MQLDKTGIVIRERGWMEMLDLALQVIRRHGRALLAALAAGAIPAAALNHFLLTGLFLDPVELAEEMPLGYIWWQLVLTAVEIPIATSFITLYLGRSMFVRQPRPREIFREFLGCLPQLLWFEAIIRGGLAFFWVGWLAPYCFWPYLNEVILLERNPWRARAQGVITTFRRGSMLHAGFSGEFLAHWLASLAVGAGLIVSLWLSIWYLRGIMSGEWRLDRGMYVYVLPGVEWLVMGYFSVVRYLGYLNLRIRREGWEVELKLRAERARLATQVA